MESDKEFAGLGSGEKECLVLCKQFRDSILLICDLKEKDYCEFSEEEKQRLIKD